MQAQAIPTLFFVCFSTAVRVTYPRDLRSLKNQKTAAAAKLIETRDN